MTNNKTPPNPSDILQFSDDLPNEARKNPNPRIQMPMEPKSDADREDEIPGELGDNKVNAELIDEGENPDVTEMDHGSEDSIDPAQAPQEDLVKTCRKELEEAQKQSKDHLDLLQRLKAEFENYRKRQQRERLQWEQMYKDELVTKFLPILDNLERALVAAQGEKTPEAYILGQEIIIKQFLTVLDELGVKKIQAEGKPFDPNFHCAIMTETREGTESGFVLQEVLSGFESNGRAIRPSRVIVSS